MSAKQIQNDEEYQKSRDWLLLTAAELADPLKVLPDREKTMALYDRVSALMGEYNRGRVAGMFPGIRKIYAELGWNYSEVSQQEPEQQPQPEAKPPEPEPPQQQEQVQNKLAAWLDD